MKNYLLMHKNIITSAFSIEDNNVIKWIIPKKNNSIMHLPLQLKIVMHYKLYDTESENSYTITTEDYTYKLQQWLEERSIPTTRNNIEAYTSRNKTLKYMLDNSGLSLVDCYWIKELHDTRSWDDVKLYNSNKIDTLSVINKSRDEGEKYSGINSTLGGQLEKYWYYSYSNNEKRLMLAKRTDRLNCILSIREVIASKLYAKQGYKNYCSYKYIRNTFGEIAGCKCRAFTDEQHEIVTAYELLAEYNDLHTEDTYGKIVHRACAYGCDVKQVKCQLDMQTVIDYIISNRDRHLNNIAFLRNPDTLQIYCIAPIFDSGSSQFMEGKRPYGVTGSVINGAYKTDDETLSTLNIEEIRTKIEIDKLLSVRDIQKELDKDISGYNYRYFTDMYQKRIEFLRILLKIN